MSDKPNLSDWASLAQKELKDRPLDDLTWDTPEGIAVKPIYTAADVEGIDALDGVEDLADLIVDGLLHFLAGDSASERRQSIRG